MAVLGCAVAIFVGSTVSVVGRLAAIVGNPDCREVVGTLVLVVTEGTSVGLDPTVGRPVTTGCVGPDDSVAKPVET